MKIYIFVDDVRNPIDIYATTKPEEYIIARTYNEAITLLNTYKKEEIYISLDHDLGEEKTGYDIAKYIVEHQFPQLYFFVHSANPVGRDNINQLLLHYGYEERCYWFL